MNVEINARTERTHPTWNWERWLALLAFAVAALARAGLFKRLPW